MWGMRSMRHPHRCPISSVFGSSPPGPLSVPERGDTTSSPGDPSMIVTTTTTSASLFLMAVLACIATPVGAQSPESLDLTAVGRDPRWKIVGRTTSIVDIKGKHALELGEGKGMGVVWLEGYDFADGVIEVDILGRSQPIQ